MWLFLILVSNYFQMSTTAPWKSERWLPGVLNFRQIQSLIDYGLIQNAKEQVDSDASAIDLHLSAEVYEMLRGSVKPFDRNYSKIIKDSYYAKRHVKEMDDSFLLKKEHCYVFKIQEELHPDVIGHSPFYGQATAKSSIGRVDVIARLIVDGMKEYEKFNPDEITTGEMFLEITPITFDVKVKEGESISQLRFCNGGYESSLITDEKFIRSILNVTTTTKNFATLSVDVSNFEIKEGEFAAAYCAKSNLTSVIELWGEKKYDPKEFWEKVQSKEVLNKKSITIRKNNFYILRSVERISLPEGVCIYCRAMDETLGEMRIHYAGFVHPLFGLKRQDNEGTPLIFEVRGHNVDVLLTQEEILARLFFYRMSQNAEEPRKKSSSTQEKSIVNVSYGDQELKLSKFFKSWE